MSYRLSLPSNLLGVQPEFHVSMLKRYHEDEDYTVRWDSIVLEKSLYYQEETIAILDHDVCRLRTKELSS